MLDPKEARKRLREALREEFNRLKEQHKGGLERAAKEIGVSRQQLQQWANGVPIPSDALLMAFMKWGSIIRLDDDQAKKGETAWWEFSLSAIDGGFQKRRFGSAQPSIFDALSELQKENLDVKILRKGPGRLELGVDIGFKKIRF